MSLTSDYQQILGVDASATPDDIKRAHRKLSLQYHPDHNPGDTQAEDLFKRIYAAYEFLTGSEDYRQHEEQEEAKRQTAASLRARQERRKEDEARRTQEAAGMGTVFSMFGTGQPTSSTSQKTAREAEAAAQHAREARERAQAVIDAKRRKMEAELRVQREAREKAQQEAAAEQRAQEAARQRVEQEKRDEEAQRQVEADRAKAARVRNRRATAYRVTAAAGIAASLIAIVIAVNSGGLSAVAKERKAAETRVAALKFECLERFTCNADPLGYPPPVFIDGMDYNLVSYLQYHGYTDSWTGNAGFADGRTIGKIPPPVTEGVSRFVASERPREKAGSKDYLTGLMYYDPGNESPGPNGSWPTSIPANGIMTITWKLKSPAGRVIKELQFSVKVGECPAPEEGEESYCDKVDAYRQGSNPSNLYTGKLYEPPPQFPINTKNWGPDRTATSAL